MSMAYTSWASISISGTFWTSSPWAIVLLPSITNLAKGNTTYTWGRDRGALFQRLQRGPCTGLDAVQRVGVGIGALGVDEH
jgi:hypothetical protein